MVARKWLFAGMVTLCSLGVVLAAPPATHPVTGEPLVITCYKGTPAALDGDLSDWNLEAMTPAVLDAAGQMYTGQASWTGPADLSGKFYLMWDDTKVYLAVVVKDDRISMNKANGDIWNADCIEVFFGTTNAVAPHAEHYQYGFNPNNQKWNWCNMDSGGQTLPAYMEVGSRTTPDGYVCEAAIEYGQIKALNWTPGTNIGFHPVLDDTDDTDREIQMTWTSREAHDQSLGFGYLYLSSEAAIAKEIARHPNPANKATDVAADGILSWDPGEGAASHDIYLGTAFADVNTATRTSAKGVLVSQGQAGTTFDPPARLPYGQTYYWRIDEVSGNTVSKGQVWSFTVESYGYPIQPVAATASTAQLNMGPAKTIDGSGLDLMGRHGTEGTTMWLSTGVGTNWIQYEFDKVYKLAEMKVWNSNGLIESFMGFGAKQVKVEISTDGTTWTALESVPEFAKAPGLPEYAANTTVSFGGIEGKFVKLTIEKNWGVAPPTGLSEVQFSAVPVQAFAPQPAAAAAGVSVDASLNWRAGRLAASHNVFFGTDQAAVAGGTATTKTVTGHSYAPGDLNFGTTYYWKVDEVNTVTYPGEVWSFSTQEYALVEDFESYTDKPGIEIFSTWIDGLTDGLSNSIVGYATAVNGTFGETMIIHGGRQSMPFEYDNVKAPYYSEAVRTFDQTQDWTGNGADTLNLWVYGQPVAFVDKGNGAFTVGASGHDIWDAADDFRFVYKQLSGDGSILVKVDSLVNTNAWAKGGVMIRETLEDNSKMVYAIVSFSSGVAMGQRVSPGASAVDGAPTVAGIAAPQWVKLTRKGNAFSAQYSADGKTWLDFKSPALTGTVVSSTITMGSNVYIGLCVTSHNSAATTTAELSGVATTGNVTGAWQQVWVGDDPDRTSDATALYVVVEDKAGKNKTVAHPNPAAAATGAWTQWRIPFGDLTGVNLAAVKKLTIGAGDKANPKPGGAGLLYIDDIGFGHPMP
jgi:regulation of enolase protein 1 (concanavalin A-like superfamily)